MTVNEQAKNERQSNPCTVAGRIIAFALVAITVCAFMSQFINPQGSGNEFLEKMSEMVASCFGIQQEDDKTIRKA